MRLLPHHTDLQAAPALLVCRVLLRDSRHAVKLESRTLVGDAHVDSLWSRGVEVEALDDISVWLEGFNSKRKSRDGGDSGRSVVGQSGRSDGVAVDSKTLQTTICERQLE